MTEIDTTAHTPAAFQGFDVFAAARWLSDVWNSSAVALSLDRIEWQCNTWGSGRGFGDWADTAVLRVAAEVFDLPTGKNSDGRDELVVSVPMANFADIARLVSRLGRMGPEEWPWFDEDVEDPIGVAADFLQIPQAILAEDTDLLEALRLE